jgi:poly-gamma-glutamate system protein
LLVVSLGASTWGANHPDIPWPVLATELRSGGFIHHRADFYTLGAGDETGQGLAPEGMALLRSAANDTGVKLLSAGNLKEMIARKTELLDKHQPRLLVSIGGSHANLGDAHEVLQLHTGLVPATDTALAGNGVIGAAMRKGTPVIHMLNIKSISSKTGIPYDTRPRERAPGRGSTWWSGFGLILFFIVLLNHKRWRLESAVG